MINAASCKAYSLINIDKYCTNNIEPLLLKACGKPVYFGKYNSSGTKICYIDDLYASKAPEVKILKDSPVSPIDIKEYLEKLGYKVDWVKVDEPYLAGYFSSGKTRYYNAGFVTYYSLKISY